MSSLVHPLNTESVSLIALGLLASSEVQWRRHTRRRNRGEFVELEIQGVLPCGCHPRVQYPVSGGDNAVVYPGARVRIYRSGSNAGLCIHLGCGKTIARFSRLPPAVMKTPILGC